MDKSAEDFVSKKEKKSDWVEVSDFDHDTSGGGIADDWVDVAPATDGAPASDHTTTSLGYGHVGVLGDFGVESFEGDEKCADIIADVIMDESDLEELAAEIRRQILGENAIPFSDSVKLTNYQNNLEGAKPPAEIARTMTFLRDKVKSGKNFEESLRLWRELQKEKETHEKTARKDEKDNPHPPIPVTDSYTTKEFKSRERRLAYQEAKKYKKAQKEKKGKDDWTETVRKSEREATVGAAAGAGAAPAR